MKSKTETEEQSSAAESVEEAARAIPELDAKQKEVIATLASTFEFWQTGATAYNPLESHDSMETRYEAGQAIRKRVPFESHAEWKPPALRPSGVDFVIAGNAGRQEGLVPLRMGRMAASPFAFLRGALLARAHSRMGDAAKIAGYCGRSEHLDEALAEFAESYGDQTETDHASLVKAIKKGRVKALEGI